MNRDTFLQIYRDVKSHGQLSEPRGQKILEIENYMVNFDSSDPCTSFKARKFNLRYAKDEFIWYLGADRFDKSISEKAGTWKTLLDVDGGYNSNYGVYIFGQKQFDWCFDELSRDKDSRRAIIMLAHKDQVRIDNPDHICTYSISFRIRQNKLNMSIRMRSWDAIFGMTNDIFAFSIVHLMMFAKLRDMYPELRLGKYNHVADSIHIYERHWPMLDQLIADGINGWERIWVPVFSDGLEVDQIINSKGKRIVNESIFSAWLLGSD